MILETNKRKIDFSNVSSGTYWLKIGNFSKKFTVRKVIKQ